MGRQSGFWAVGRVRRSAAMFFATALGALTVALGTHEQAAASSVVAWGANGYGELGDGTSVESDVPVVVSGLGKGVAVSTRGHSLALLSDGTAVAWGRNSWGALGDGTTTGPETCILETPCSRIPVQVSGLGEVTAISAGYGHNLALLTNGTVMAWGRNSLGQLGSGTTTASDVPVAVKGLTGVTAVEAGEEASLALLKNGTVMAWGSNYYGQLGSGTGKKTSDLPQPIPGLSGVTAIALGKWNGLALLSNGTVMAWGRNTYAELGDGTTTESDVPVPVKGLSGVTAVAAGGLHSLALLNDGRVRTWGYDGYVEPPCHEGGCTTIKGTHVIPDYGPQGGGTTVTITGGAFTGATAVKFGSTDARSFTVNSSSSITAVSPAGAASVNVTVTTPQGTTSRSKANLFSYYSDVPVPKSGLSEVTAISAGEWASLALLGNGTATAWGGNSNGQLGNGTRVSSLVPTPVAGLNGVTAISAGAEASLAVGTLVAASTR
jgi:alpha-tubulin suppressor-like RCC1 family protein